MRRGLLLFIIFIFSLSVVSAYTDTDAGFESQEFIPWQILGDAGGVYLSDLCSIDSDVWQTYMILERVLLNDLNWYNPQFQIIEYCLEGECPDGTIVENSIYDGIYSVTLKCEFGCAYVDEGPDYCITEDFLSNAVERKSESVDGECVDADGGNKPKIPGSVEVGESFYLDYCQEGYLGESHCNVNEYFYYEWEDCEYGCVSQKEGADFCGSRMVSSICNGSTRRWLNLGYLSGIRCLGNWFASLA